MQRYIVSAIDIHPPFSKKGNMKRYLSLVVFAFATVYFVSCSCKGLVQCGTGSLGFRIIGYSITDIDSMLMVRYKAGSNFDSLIDTSGMYPDNGDYGLNHETCFLDWAAAAGYDYKIIFPTVGTTFLISNMQVSGPSSEEMSYKCEEGSPQQSCDRTVTSFTVNGQNYTQSNPVFTIVR